MSRTTSLIAASTLAVAVSAGIAAGSSHLASPSAPGGAANAGLSGPQLQSAFTSAAAKGTAVHVKGAFKQGTESYSLDLNLDADGQTQGEVTQDGAVLPVKKVNGVTYVQLTPSFLKLEAASDPSLTPDVVKSLQNKWVSSQTSVGKSLAAGFGDLTDYHAFTTMLAGTGTTPAPSTPASSSTPAPEAGTASASPSSSSGITLSNLTAAGTAEVGGQNLAVYENSAAQSTAYFAANGPAYLEKLTSAGTETGSADFVWNKPVTVTAPPSSELFNG